MRELKLEIGLIVKMLGPISLAKAVSIARIQEQTLIVRNQIFSYSSPHNSRNNNRFTPTFSYGSIQPAKPTQDYPRPQNTTPNNSTTRPNNNPNVKPNLKYAKLPTPVEMDERRNKGLYFHCDEKYTYGHVCENRRQLYYMKVEEGCEKFKELGDEDVVL